MEPTCYYIINVCLLYAIIISVLQTRMTSSLSVYILKGAETRESVVDNV